MMEIGVRVTYGGEFGEEYEDLMKGFGKVLDMGITSCQLSVWDEEHITDEKAAYVKECIDKTGIKVSSVWAGWGSGPTAEWNFRFGPETLGIVPPAYRGARLEFLKKASRFTQLIGVENMITHVGFIPENMTDPNFAGVVGALRNLCSVMKKRGQYFLFETGQETPVTLLRTIEAVGMDNLGINLDTANLILYGKANPVDAIEVFGKYVRDTHCKDGLWPTTGTELGKETRMGDGKVDFYNVVKSLYELGYTGPLTIEREITGDEQVADIIHARKMLEDIKESLGIK